MKQSEVQSALKTYAEAQAITDNADSESLWYMYAFAVATLVDPDAPRGSHAKALASISTIAERIREERLDPPPEVMILGAMQ